MSIELNQERVDQNKGVALLVKLTQKRVEHLRRRLDSFKNAFAIALTHTLKYLLAPPIRVPTHELCLQ